MNTPYLHQLLEDLDTKFLETPLGSELQKYINTVRGIGPHNKAHGALFYRILIKII